jgi:hypothetical protein
MAAIDPLSAATFVREASVKHEFQDSNWAIFQSCAKAHNHLLLDKDSDEWHVVNTEAGPSLADMDSKRECHCLIFCTQD